MKKHRHAAAVAVAAIAPALLVPAVAPAHRSWCHSSHACPSDHATYTWHGKWCVKPSAEERTSAFKKKVRYAGLTYYCKEAAP